MANSRRIGRRRGRPIGSRNSRVNQYIRIRSLIWKNRKDQYSSYFDPALLDISRRVNDECKTAGMDCDDNLILSFHDEWAEGGRQYPLPSLNPFLLRPQHYWIIKDVADFGIESANVYFYSPMLIAPPSGFRSLDYASYIDYDGTTRLSFERGYRRYFKEWVDWVNSYYRENNIDDSELVEVYFMCLQPVWDESRGYWIVEVVSCTSDGRIDNFGFTPTGDGEQSTEDFQVPQPPTQTIPEPQPQQPQQPTTPPPPTREQVEAIALQKEKELERLLVMKKDAKDDYKFWKEEGDAEEVADAKKRIKEITKQIDNLRNGS